MNMNKVPSVSDTNKRMLPQMEQILSATGGGVGTLDNHEPLATSLGDFEVLGGELEEGALSPAAAELMLGASANITQLISVKNKWIYHVERGSYH